MTMRPLMTSAELATHKAESHGRDYRLSDDGYGDMEVGAKRGWVAVSAWGHDGWDLGDWPYVVISTRDHDGQFQVQQVVEGDHDLYSFENEDDRNAAIDYLFLWYGQSRSRPPVEVDREALDAGAVVVDDKYRGPFSWKRLDTKISTDTSGDVA